jgi:hypothetical protein
MADGKTRKTIDSDIVRGTVLRTVNQDGSVPPFPDSVITGISNGYVFLARPMVWDNGKLHVEEYSTTVEMAVSSFFFHTVLTDRGEPYKMIGV